MVIGKGGIFNKDILGLPSKILLSLTFFFFLITSSMQIISADVFVIDSGGSTNFSVSSDRYIGGYYPELGICGDGFLESANSEQCDDSNTASGDGCSATCQTETVTPPGDGGGGGGGEAQPNINLTPTELNVNLALDSRVEKTIQIENLGTSQIVLTASQSGLDNVLVIPNPTMTIPAGQTVNLNLIFVSLNNETGIFTGTINIGGKSVFVVVNVRTQLLLFDSNIVILNENFEVEQKGELRTSVTLIPLGDEERLDVSLFFTIKDYAGNTYLTKTETLLISELTQLNRNFDLGNIQTGDYVIGLELRYPNGVAPSSAHFKIVSRKGAKVGKLILFMVSLILLAMIVILSILIARRLRRGKEQATETPAT